MPAQERPATTLPACESKVSAGGSGLPRVPAAEVEAAVLDQFRRLLSMPGMVADVVTRGVELGPMLDDAQVTAAMTRLDAIWNQLFVAGQQRIVRLWSKG